VNKRDLYRDAKAALAEASQLEQGIEISRAAVNAARWRAAEDMSQLYDLGESQREIAEALGVGKTTLSQYLRVWETNSGHARVQSLDFGECLKEIRGGWGHEPASTAKRAEATVNYLSDREIWKDPDVQKVMRKQVYRDVREESRPAPPKDTTTKLTVITGSYWNVTLAKLKECTDLLREAVKELDRSGLPNVQSGALVRQTRALAGAAAKFEDRLTEDAIGRSS
jgi:hypothetical protein